MESNIKKIVISGINLYEGGPLSIFYDCLNCIKENELYKKCKIIIFVHKMELFEKYSDCVEIIEIPRSRKCYIYRLYYEFVFFKNWSKNKDIDIWISLHDITPRVYAKKIYTYCHNPSPFMEKKITNLKYSVTYMAFALFYKYLYRLNIKNADAIIVQQDWMRTEFKKLFPVKNVIVAKPNILLDYQFEDMSNDNNNTIFIFPSYPRFFKNFEVICEASKMLEDKNYEIWLTMDGSENKYSREIQSKYKDDLRIKWLGLQKREDLFALYNMSDCLIFPSYLETWGLPISEYKQTHKPMILVDLPYSHETLGNYKNVLFFKNNDAYDLKEKMNNVILKQKIFSNHIMSQPKQPFANDWKELLEILLND